MRWHRAPDSSFFSRAVRFENPVNGKLSEVMLCDLRERAAVSTAKLIAKFAALVEGTETNPEKLLASEHGRSLSSGLYRTTMDEMKFFSSPPSVGARAQ